MMPNLEENMSLQTQLHNAVYEPTQVVDKPPEVPVPLPGSPVLDPLKMQTNKRKQQFGSTQQAKRPKK